MLGARVEKHKQGVGINRISDRGVTEDRRSFRYFTFDGDIFYKKEIYRETIDLGDIVILVLEEFKINIPELVASPKVTKDAFSPKCREPR